METLTTKAVAQSPDANVEAIREKLLIRSQIGLKKYGVTTERQDIDLEGWLIHLQQELMDASVYVEATLRRLQASRSPHPEHAPSTACPDPEKPAEGSTSTQPVSASTWTSTWSLPLEEFLAVPRQ
jgi:hypothetical protein